jgi:hypothetical protein
MSGVKKSCGTNYERGYGAEVGFGYDGCPGLVLIQIEFVLIC